MALIKCPECGHDVSSSANACPGCGFPIQSYVANLYINGSNEIRNSNRTASENTDNTPTLVHFDESSIETKGQNGCRSSKHKKSILIPLGCGIVFLCLVIGAILIWRLKCVNPSIANSDDVQNIVSATNNPEGIEATPINTPIASEDISIMPSITAEPTTSAEDSYLFSTDYVLEQIRQPIEDYRASHDEDASMYQQYSVEYNEKEHTFILSFSNSVWTDVVVKDKNKDGWTVFTIGLIKIHQDIRAMLKKYGRDDDHLCTTFYNYYNPSRTLITLFDDDIVYNIGDELP